MAKAKTLAALAGLAGLAYAYNKYKNKDGKDEGMTPKQNDDLATANRISKLSDESDALARSNKGMSPGQSAADDTNAGVLKALTTPKAAPNDKAPNQGVVPPKSLGKSAAKAVASTPSDPRSLEAGMSRGTVNREKLTKDYAQNEFNDGTRTFTSPGPYSSIQEVQKLNDTLEGRAGVSTSSARKTDAMKVASRAAAAADARRRMAQQSSYKSGGMTSSASSRADGIATKGKTRGKIC